MSERTNQECILNKKRKSIVHLPKDKKVQIRRYQSQHINDIQNCWEILTDYGAQLD